jgi:hypothetical protein
MIRFTFLPLYIGENPPKIYGEDAPFILRFLL